MTSTKVGFIGSGMMAEALGGGLAAASAALPREEDEQAGDGAKHRQQRQEVEHHLNARRELDLQNDPCTAAHAETRTHKTRDGLAHQSG